MAGTKEQPMGVPVMRPLDLHTSVEAVGGRERAENGSPGCGSNASLRARVSPCGLLFFAVAARSRRALSHALDKCGLTGHMASRADLTRAREARVRLLWPSTADGLCFAILQWPCTRFRYIEKFVAVN